MEMNVMPAGWLADPTGRHEYRYWDSLQWTESVSDGGVVTIDPPTLVTAPSLAASRPPPATAPALAPSAPAPMAPAAVPPAGVPTPPTGPIPAPVGPSATTSFPKSEPALGAREIAVPDGRRFYLGSVFAGLGLVFYAVLSAMGVVFGLGSGGGAPLLYLGSRDVGFSGTEYYVPGLLFLVLALLMLVLQPRMDRTLKDRQSRQFLTQQLGLRTSWRYTTAYVAKSFRWRRIACAIGGAVLLLVAVIAALVISADGFTLAFPAFLFMFLGALVLIGTGIMLTTPSRRLRVDSGGRILEALE